MFTLTLNVVQGVSTNFEWESFLEFSILAKLKLKLKKKNRQIEDILLI